MRTVYWLSSGCSFNMKENLRSTLSKKRRRECKNASSRGYCNSSKVESLLEAEALTIHQKRRLKQVDANNPKVLPS